MVVILNAQPASRELPSAFETLPSLTFPSYTDRQPIELTTTNTPADWLPTEWHPMATAVRQQGLHPTSGSFGIRALRPTAASS
jgi:hypothetical protein